MFVSVIIPVYNVQDYLEQCLDSVVHQTYRNLEIILVNDGSTDDSGKICDQYARLDKRIKVIHKENGGLMSAWMAGITVAKGEYTTFVDSDDWVALNMIQVFVETHMREGGDLVIARLIQEFPDGQIANKERLTPGHYQTSDIFPILLDDGSFKRAVYFCRCGKLIKTDLIKNNLSFCNPKIAYGEDMNIIFPVLLDSQSFTLVDDCLYHYRQQNQSIMNAYKQNMLEQISLLLDAMKRVNAEKDIYDFSHQIQRSFTFMLIEAMRNELHVKEFSEEKIKILQTFLRSSAIKPLLQNQSLSNISMNNKIVLQTVKWNRLFLYRIFHVLYQIKLKRQKMVPFEVDQAAIP